jgi:hypothetical protein
MATVQNTLTVIGDTTTAYNIKPTQFRKLQRLERSTGISITEAIDRAVALFTDIEVPIYLADAKQRRRQKV